MATSDSVNVTRGTAGSAPMRSTSSLPPRQSSVRSAIARAPKPSAPSASLIPPPSAPVSTSVPAPSLTIGAVPKNGHASVAVREAPTEKQSPSVRSTPTASAFGVNGFTVTPQFVEASVRSFVTHQVAPPNVMLSARSVAGGVPRFSWRVT